MDYKAVDQNERTKQNQVDKNQSKEGDITGAPASQAPASQSPASQIKKVFVVLNPVAGLTDADTAKQQIVQFCEERGWECDIHETKKDEDPRGLIKEAQQKGVDLVIAAGGDGTVSDVVSGMVGSEIPMGILPAGTGNNLARDLSIPLDLPGALALLGGDHDVETMDVMEVNEKSYYVLNVSVGISSMTMRKTKRHEKRRFGMFAYLYRAIGTLINSDVHRFTATVDNRRIRFSASEVMITNHKLMGLQPQVEGVEVDADDGRLDMFIVRAKSLPQYLYVFSRFIRPVDPEEDTKINYLEVRDSISIHSDVSLPAQADGEVIGSTPVTVRLIPHALRVIVPCPQKPNK